MIMTGRPIESADRGVPGDVDHHGLYPPKMANVVRRRSRPILYLAAALVVLAAAVWLVVVRRQASWRLAAEPRAAGQGTAGGAPAAATGRESGEVHAAGQARRPPRLMRPSGAFHPAAFRAFHDKDADPEEAFSAETRDPRWAPAMESRIRSELAGDIARLKLPGTKVHSLDCRRSSCRIEVDFRSEDMALAQTNGAVHPVELLIMKGGHLASVETDVKVRGARAMNGSDESVAVLPDGSFRKTVVLTFGEVDIDPGQYGRWREEDVANLNAPEPEGAR